MKTLKEFFLENDSKKINEKTVVQFSRKEHNPITPQEFEALKKSKKLDDMKKYFVLYPNKQIRMYWFWSEDDGKSKLTYSTYDYNDRKFFVSPRNPKYTWTE